MSSSTTQDNVKNLASKAWSNSSVSDIYEQTRPDYNLDSVEFLLRQLGALQQRSQEFVITELGAGTGKYTRAMIKVLEQHSSRENVKIIATEPLEEMCDKFKEMVPGVKILQCAASNIGKIQTLHLILIHIGHLYIRSKYMIFDMYFSICDNQMNNCHYR